MKLIPLTQGKFAKVDDEDFDWLSQWKWMYNGGYAVRSSPRINGKQYAIFMHRVIVATPQGLQTDHIDHDKLNNQRYNLRTCTRSENQCNRTAQGNNTSGFKGVSYYKRNGKWDANIGVNGSLIHLGCFTSPEQAAKAYDDAAIMYHGDFALLNFPDRT